MDFQNDIVTVVKTLLDSYGVKYDNCRNNREVVERWVNVELKLIRPKPRCWIESSKIRKSLWFQRYKDVIERIKTEVQQGEDLNKYLSTSIFTPDYQDLLFYDWGIYHFHLGKKLSGQFFVERTDHLLFLMIDNETILLIDIRPHKENYVFYQKEFLEIAVSEWPEHMKKFEIKGFVDIKPNVSDPKDICDLRKSGVNMIHKVGDKILAPCGGGITTASTGINLTFETDRLFRMARNAEKWVKENLDWFGQRLGIESEKLKFSFLLFENRWHVYESSTKTKISLDSS